MKRFLAPLAFLTIAAALLPVAVPPAYACICGGLQSEEKMRQVIAYYDLVVLGALTTPPADVSPQDRISIRVERVYKGAAPPVLALSQTISETDQLKRQELPAFFGEGTTAMCGYEIAGNPGERYLLFLMARPDGSYEPGGCASHAEKSSKWSDTVKRDFDLVEAVAGPSSLPVGGGRPSAQPGPRIPRLPIALASGAGGAALLAASAFLLHRRIMGGDDSNPGP